MLRPLLFVCVSFVTLAPVGASTWTITASPRNWRGITSSSDGTKLAAVVFGDGNTKHIYTSVNSGETWTERASQQQWQSITSSSDGTKLAATVWKGNIYTSVNSGLTWTPGPFVGNDGKDWRGITSSSDGTKLAAVVENGDIWTFALRPCTCCERIMKSFGFSVGAEDCDPEL